MKINLRKKCDKIKIVLTDVDGVLTDGGMYYTKDGDIMKKFFTRDGMGVTLLKKKNIATIIVTKEQSEAVKQWATKMKIEKLHDGIKYKESILDEIRKKYTINLDEIAYIGDDINDVKLLRKVGLSVAPNDAIKAVKKECDYICSSKSGSGAFREFADLILSYKTEKS